MPWEKEDNIEKINNGSQFVPGDPLTPDTMNSIVNLLVCLKEV